MMYRYIGIKNVLLGGYLVHRNFQCPLTAAPYPQPDSKVFGGPDVFTPFAVPSEDLSAPAPYYVPVPSMDVLKHELERRIEASREIYRLAGRHHIVSWMITLPPPVILSFKCTLL